jgi:hypothetical protein
MAIFTTADLYIECATTLKEKIARVDAVIAALETTALKMAANDNISEYWLNDGQTQIKTVYKGADAVMKSIMAFEALRQLYIQRYNGRRVRLVDSKNFTGGRYGNR